MKLGENDLKLYLGSAEVEKIYLGTEQVYSGGSEPTPPHDYSQDYLTIESTSDNNTISWKKRASNKQGKTISASTDNGSTWIEYTSTSGNGITIATLNSGDKLLIKGENATYYEYFNPQGIFASTSSFIVYGNTMSLIYGDNFAGQTTLEGTYTFREFFRETNVVSAENLILPATTMVQYCYTGMFEYCTSLTTAPELPATTLVSGCYAGMFGGCTNLTTAPELPATRLVSDCYGNMFGGCTSLTIAPVLPATTLADGCYWSMFRDCTSLTTAPHLPATTLANYCYQYMFRNCTSLNYIKCLATDISATQCTQGWLNNVASSGTFTKAASMTSWGSGASGIPTGWTVENAEY